MKRRLIFLLSMILASVFALDALLRYADPLGIVRYTNDSALWISLVTPDPNRYYHIAVGSLHLSNWTLTINADGTRAVPATTINAPCTVVTIGDSQTFAMGVSDVDTWPNLFARRYPAVHIVNAGLPGTNADDALLNIQAFSNADGYLYLLSENDADAPPPLGNWHMGEDRPALALYWTYLHAAPYGAGATRDTLWQTLDTIAANPRVQIVAYRGGTMVGEAAARYPALVLVPMYKGVISVIDKHANVAGNVETTDALESVFAKFISKVCKPLF